MSLPAVWQESHFQVNQDVALIIQTFYNITQASLVDLKHEVAAAKTLSDTATTVLQSSKNKPQDQHSISTPDELEGHNKLLCTWLVMGVRNPEAAIIPNNLLSTAGS